MRKWAIFLFIVNCLFFCSCSEDMPSSSHGEWKVYLADHEQEAIVPCLSSFESIRVSVEGKDAHENIVVSSSESWLKLEKDTLPEDGIVAVETQTNEEDRRREATLTLTSVDNPQHVGQIKVCQLSQADNASNGNPQDNFYLGYGYDIYKKADSQKSVHTREPVIDCDKLRQYTSADTYETIHDCKISRTELKYCTALSIYQFSSELTSATIDNEGQILGCLYDCKDALSYCNSSETTEQNYGRGTMVKTVVSKVMDRGALDDLKRKNKLQFVFSDGFLKAYNAAKNKSGEQRMEAFKDLLAKYGTHVITQADLGGKITYTFTMNKSTSVDNEQEMKEEIDFTLGTMQGADRNELYQHQVSSSKNMEGAINILGGSHGTRVQLLTEAMGLTPSKQLSAESVTNWLASINYDEKSRLHTDLDVVHFELIPLWDLVEDKYRVEFLNATLEMLQRSDCSLPADMISSALYKIDMTRSDLMDFSGSSTGSLCRTLYRKNGTSIIPILEVCQEYVPQIRTDKRVTIVYPIYKNRIRLTQGLFLGDGVHPAAKVAFGESQAYVAPIASENKGAVYQTIYYANGVLSVKDSGIKYADEEDGGRYVRDDVLMLRTVSADNKLHKHPIVKVGNMFWTRDNIDHNMMFTEYPDKRNANNRDIMKNGMLYTRFQYDVGFWFKVANRWTYGYSPLETVEGKPNLLWYLPSPDMLTNLYAYLGFNPKALFKGQCAGFDAQFLGYVGDVDVLHPNQKFAISGNQLRYDNQLCVLASRNTDSRQSPSLLILHPDYRWQLVDDASLGTDWHRNYYPVRLCRGAYYIFPDWETLKKKEQ